MPATSGKVRSLTNSPHFLKGARDQGIDLPGAVSEMVDNSLDAGADLVEIYVEGNGDNHRIVVGDDGKGIPKTIEDEDGVEWDGLTYCVSFGGRIKDRDVEIGKFGWGLPASACCQSKLTQIWTTTKGEDGWRYTELDLEAMQESGDTTPPQSEYEPLPDHLDIDEDRESGTIIVLEKADRTPNKRASTVANKIKNPLGEVFRDYLFAGRRITVNGDKVRPFDPLFRSEDARSPVRRVEEPHNPKNVPTVDDLYTEETIFVESPDEDDDEKYPVHVQIAMLPVKKIRQKDDWDSEWMKQAGLTLRNQGFYLVRNNRQIGGGEALNLFTKHNDKNYFRGEIRFPPELDYYFGIQTHKSRFGLKDQMRDKLEERIGDIPNQIGQRTTEIVNELKSDAQADKREQEQTLSEKIAEDGDSILKTRERLSDAEEKELREELEEELNEKLEQIEARKDLDEDKKEQEKQKLTKKYESFWQDPFKITFGRADGFYRVRKKGRQTQVIIDDRHEFFEEYQDAADDPERRVLLDLILMSAAHSERMYSDNEQMMRAIEQYRAEWSTALKVFLQMKPSTVEEAMKEMGDPLARSSSD